MACEPACSCLPPAYTGATAWQTVLVNGGWLLGRLVVLHTASGELPGSGSPVCLWLCMSHKQLCWGLMGDDPMPPRVPARRQGLPPMLDVDFADSAVTA